MMSEDKPVVLAPRGDHTAVETGKTLQLKFDDKGLVPAIVTSAEDGTVLMFAWMNEEALRLTLRNRQAHFWSRSRNRLWRKGEESGNVLMVDDVKVDCDQDVVWLVCRMQGGGKACHTGRRSCFYRRVDWQSLDDGEAVGLKDNEPS
jgi:phosphoribosyl-AMP cyclohydrolase